MGPKVLPGARPPRSQAYATSAPDSKTRAADAASGPRRGPDAPAPPGIRHARPEMPGITRNPCIREDANARTRARSAGPEARVDGEPCTEPQSARRPGERRARAATARAPRGPVRRGRAGIRACTLAVAVIAMFTVTAGVVANPVAARRRYPTWDELQKAKANTVTPPRRWSRSRTSSPQLAMNVETTRAEVREAHRRAVRRPAGVRRRRAPRRGDPVAGRCRLGRGRGGRAERRADRRSALSPAAPTWAST